MLCYQIVKQRIPQLAKDDKKYLITGGCSFTNNEFVDFVQWPEITAAKLGLQLINTARSGDGNQRIYHNVLYEVLKHNPKDIIVIIAFSDFVRLEFMLEDYDRSGHKKLKEIEKTILEDDDNMIECIDELSKQSLHYMISLQSIFKELNIEYYFTQAIYPYPTAFNFPNIVDKIIATNIINTPLIDTSKFLGWPIMKRLGGFTFNDKVKTYGNYNISETDFHVNAEGQKVMSDIMYNFI